MVTPTVSTPMGQMVFIEYTRDVTVIADFVYGHALALGFGDEMG